MLTREEICRLSDSFESKTPQEILTWAIAEFWLEIALNSSFQTQSMPLLHMAARILELQKDRLLKVNPLLNWTKAEAERYITEHNLPRHPLLERGFRSVGCQPCTQPVTTGENDRAGRWPGLGKTDCGLHNEMFQQRNLNEARKFFAINSLKALDLEGEK